MTHTCRYCRKPGADVPIGFVNETPVDWAHAECLRNIGSPTGRTTQREPALQNIPLRTETGRALREALTKPCTGYFDNGNMVQDCRTYEGCGRPGCKYLETKPARLDASRKAEGKTK